MQSNRTSPTPPAPVKRQPRLQGCLPSYKTVLKIEGGILGVALVACLIAGWEYGLTLSWVGVAAIALGGMSLVGGYGITRSFNYQHASSAGPLDIRERAKAELADRGMQFEFLILMLLIGLLTIFLGFIASMFGV